MNDLLGIIVTLAIVLIAARFGLLPEYRDRDSRASDTGWVDLAWFVVAIISMAIIAFAIG